MEEHWEQWKPHPDLSKRYRIDCIADDLDNFRLLLTDDIVEKKQLWVIFDNFIAAYRSTDESYRLQTIGFLDEKYGTAFYAWWSFFKVTNSPYLKWLDEESGSAFPSEHFMHFVFTDANSFVDVVASYEPRFEFITLP